MEATQLHTIKTHLERALALAALNSQYGEDIQEDPVIFEIEMALGRVKSIIGG